MEGVSLEPELTGEKGENSDGIKRVEKAESLA
jgi:hypothetical protein